MKLKTIPLNPGKPNPEFTREIKKLTPAFELISNAATTSDVGQALVHFPYLSGISATMFRCH